MTKSNLVDLEVILHHQTDRAVLVSTDEESDPVWIPISLAEISPIEGSIYELTLPDWKARELGFT